jgi:hypothetical protein
MSSTVNLYRFQAYYKYQQLDVAVKLQLVYGMYSIHCDVKETSLEVTEICFEFSNKHCPTWECGV